MPPRKNSIENILGPRPTDSEKAKGTVDRSGLQGPFLDPNDPAAILGPRPRTKMQRFLSDTQRVLTAEERKARKIQEARVPLTKYVRPPEEGEIAQGALYGLASLGEGLLSAENAFFLVSMAGGPAILRAIGEAAFTSILTYGGVKSADKAMQEFAAGRPGPATAEAIAGLGSLAFARMSARPLAKSLKKPSRLVEIYKQELRNRDPDLPDDVINSLGDIFEKEAESTRVQIKGLLRESQVKGQLQAPNPTHLLPPAPDAKPKFPGGLRSIRVTGETRGGSRVIELPERFFNPDVRMLPERGSESYFDTNMARIERVMDAKAAFEADGARIAKEQNFAWRKFSRWADDLKREMDGIENDMRNPNKFQALQEQLRVLETGEAPKGSFVLKGLLDDAPKSVLDETLTMKIVAGEIAGRKKGATVEYTVSGLADVAEVRKAKMALFYLEKRYPRIMDLWRRSREVNPKFNIKFITPEEMVLATGSRATGGYISSNFKGVANEIRIRISSSEYKLPIAKYVEIIGHEFWHNRDLLKFGEGFHATSVMPTKPFAELPKGITPHASELRAYPAGQTAKATFGSDLAKAKWDIIEGFLEAQQGLKELLGGERLGITPQQFSPDAYRRAKPHFRKAWEKWSQAGASINSFVETMVKHHGEVIRPYAEKFLEDEGVVAIPRGVGARKPVQNPGENLQQELNPDATTQTPDGGYKPPKSDVLRITEWFRGSEERLRKFPEAQRLMADVIEGQLKASHDTHVVDAAFLDDILTLQKRKVGPDKKMSKESQVQLRPAMEKLYKLARDNPREADRLIGSDPVYLRANKIIQWFEHFRGEIVRYKRDLYEAQMPRSKWEIFNKMEEQYGNLSIGEVLKRKNEIIKTFSADARSKNIKINDLFDEFKEYQNIKNWGIDDFITNIEVGTYKVLDKNGDVRAVGRTRKAANAKRTELLRDNPGLELTVSSEFKAPLDPTKMRRNILRGEENIIDAMRAYSAIMRKNIALEPIEAKMQRAFEADEGGILFPKNVRESLRNAMAEAKGQYSMGDEMFDILQKGFRFETKEGKKVEFKGFGGEPMTWSRFVSKARAFEGYSKLGYRPVAGFINFASGHMHTWVKVGAEYMVKGKRWAETPEGRRVLIEEEPYLGLDFAHAETSGKLKTKQSKLNPLWTFSWAEPGIRRQAYAANYVYGKEMLGLSDSAARLHARRAVRVQSFVYNTAALPRIMRGPTGKLLTQFKSYLSNEAEFIMGLSGREWARYLGMHLMLAGPRGLVLMGKSLPILGAWGAIDKIDEWLLTTTIPENVPLIGEQTVTSGLPGVVGADITAPATFQFVSDNPIEWIAGPFMSDFAVRMGKEVIGPALRGEAFVADKGVKWAAGIPVFGKYWMDLVESEISEDGWVREGIKVRFEDGKPKGYSVGRKMFKIDNRYEQFMLLNGIPNISRTRMRNLQQILRREQEVSRANASTIYRKMTDAIQMGTSPSRELIEMAVMMGLTDPGEQVKRLYKVRELEPKDRAVLQSALRERARVIGLLPDEY